MPQNFIRGDDPGQGYLLPPDRREGLVSVDVVAGDGTKVRASASMAANVTLGELDLQIGELERLVAAEVDAWIAQARAEDAAQDALTGDGGGAGRPRRARRGRAGDAGPRRGHAGPPAAGTGPAGRRGGAAAAGRPGGAGGGDHPAAGPGRPPPGPPPGRGGRPRREKPT